MKPSNFDLEGKTYSLCQRGTASDAYFQSIHECAETLQSTMSLPLLLDFVQKTAKRRRQLRSIARSASNGSIESQLLLKLRNRFSQYTTNVADHLTGLSLR